MTLIKLSPESEENVAEVMIRDFLVSSQQHLNAATAPDTPEADFRSNCAAAQLCGMVAYLLDQINQMDPGVGPDVAWELHDWCQDGEPLAQWVGEQLAKRGVDVEKLITGPESAVRCQDCNLPVDESPGRRDTRHDHCGPLPHTGPVGGPYCERCE